MGFSRRRFLGVGLAGVGLTGCHYWPSDGLFNPCLDGVLAKDSNNKEFLEKVWQGLNTDQVWDCHTHLIGLGDSQSGVYVNPNMRSILHPFLFTQFKFYLDGACLDGDKLVSIDQGYVQRLVKLHRGFVDTIPASIKNSSHSNSATNKSFLSSNKSNTSKQRKAVVINEPLDSGLRRNDDVRGVDLTHSPKLMLLAFDYNYNTSGQRRQNESAFYIPNEYAEQIARTYPHRFTWIASIHPYREDAVEALDKAVKQGAKAIKWLPAAQSIDPSSKLCDPFYQALVRHNLPLLTHSGVEYAVAVEGAEGLGNPLLFRRALDQGVRVIFAHCASLGSDLDIDKGKHGPLVPSLSLFARLMAERQYQGRVYGDISALTQINRSREAIAAVVTNQQWHDRLLNGSDYPLPGVMPVFSVSNFVNWGYLSAAEGQWLSRVRSFNPLLFDFALKRLIRINGISFASQVFETKRVFES